MHARLCSSGPCFHSPGWNFGVAGLVLSFGLVAARAEMSPGQLLQVYRENYQQLMDLGLPPTEAAAEARKVAKDSADWARRQSGESPSRPVAKMDAAGSLEANSSAAKRKPNTRTATSPSVSSPTDRQDAPAVAFKPANARPVVQQALAEVKSALKAKAEGTDHAATPTLDLIYQTARESRLPSVGTALFKSLDSLTNLLTQVTADPAKGATNTPTNGNKEPNPKKSALDKETDKIVGQLETLLSTNRFTPKAFLHVGYVTLNPFTFVPNSTPPTYFTLADGNTSAAYVEFQYNQRWAWNWLEPGPVNRGELNWVNPFSRQSDLDLQARFGYAFISSAANEVATIVGGGNVNGEFTIGAPFLKYQNDWVRYSFDVETTCGMAADRSNFDIHSTFMVGFGYHASIDSDFFPGKVLLSLHLGAGFVEVPDITDPVLGRVSVGLGRPNFNARWGVVGTTFETMLPLNASTYIVAGARLYANADPNPWSAYIGISKELGSLRKIFADDSLVGEDQ